jgi:hypothetical protein
VGVTWAVSVSETKALEDTFGLNCGVGLILNVALAANVTDRETEGDGLLAGVADVDGDGNALPERITFDVLGETDVEGDDAPLDTGDIEEAALPAEILGDALTVDPGVMLMVDVAEIVADTDAVVAPDEIEIEAEACTDALGLTLAAMSPLTVADAETDG